MEQHCGAVNNTVFTLTEEVDISYIIKDRNI